MHLKNIKNLKGRRFVHSSRSWENSVREIQQLRYMLLMLSGLGAKSINKLTDQPSEILNMQQFVTNRVFFCCCWKSENWILKEGEFCSYLSKDCLQNNAEVAERPNVIKDLDVIKWRKWYFRGLKSGKQIPCGVTCFLWDKWLWSREKCCPFDLRTLEFEKHLKTLSKEFPKNIHL